MSFLAELWDYIKSRKKFWLIPIQNRTRSGVVVMGSPSRVT